MLNRIVKFGNNQKQNQRRGLGPSGVKRGLFWPAARSIIPFRVWQSLSQVSLAVPYYHMISDEEVPHILHLYRFRTVREFAADLDFLLRHFAPVSLQDIVAHLDGRGSLPKRCFHVTFDDGFREMHEVAAPVLRTKGIPATFFLNSAFLDRGGMAHHNKISLLLDRMPKPLAKGMRQELEGVLPPPATAGACLESRLLSIRYADRQILEQIAAIAAVDMDQYVATARPYLSSEEVVDLLKQGFTIGAHSVDHPMYADLALQEQIAQTRQSIDFIVERFGVKIRAFAFPHTDVGVGPKFFAAMFDTAILDVCFGTRGFIRHFHPRNVERFSMEKTSGPAEVIIAREYARAVYHKYLARFAARRVQA
jgi:peptidoglycan/xylan/chitin deacetylase (PgdA/CDA1 family)